MQFAVCIPTSKVKPRSPAYLSKAIVNFLQVATNRLIKPHAKKVKVVKVKVKVKVKVFKVHSSRRYDRGGFVGSAGAEIRLIRWDSISFYCILFVYD